MSQDVPDEPGYFAEAADIASTGQSNHVHRPPHRPSRLHRSAGHTHPANLAERRLRSWQSRLCWRLCMVVVCWMTYGIGRIPRSREDAHAPLVAAAFVGFLPMYSHLGASANADTVLVLFSAHLVLRAHLAHRRRHRQLRVSYSWLTSGVLGMLTKERFIMVLPLAVFPSSSRSLAWRAGQTRRAKQAYRPSGLRSRLVWVAAVVAGLRHRAFVRRFPLPASYPATSMLPVVGRFPAAGPHNRLGYAEYGRETFKQFIAYFGYSART